MPATGLTETSSLKPLAERVRERQVGPCRVMTLASPVKSVVSWRGSLKTSPDFSAGEELVQSLAVSLLDKGTHSRDRFAVAEILEDRGAEVHFGSDGLYVDFYGRALRDDVPDVLEIVAEQLIEPLLQVDEFEKAKARVAASLHRSMENTGAQASGALSRRIYRPAHPNYSDEPARQLARLEELTVDDVRAYHERHFAASELKIVLVGDVDDEAVDRVVEAGFGSWDAQEAKRHFEAQAAPAEPGRSIVPMPDKQNVDVRLGHPLQVLRQDPDYEALYVGNYILGGNFSARLMTVIRDEMGLTYGIHSNFSGISTQYQGHWQVGVTLSQENIERGIEATMAEVRRFVEEGVTEEELQEKKTTLDGAFKVGLATTGGLAAALLSNAERNFPVSFLDEYPRRIEALTLGQVNEAIRRHIQPDQIQVALAGMVPGHEKEGA